MDTSEHWNVAIWDDGTIAGIYPVTGPQPVPRPDMRLVKVAPTGRPAGRPGAVCRACRADGGQRVNECMDCGHTEVGDTHPVDCPVCGERRWIEHDHDKGAVSDE